MRVKQPPRRAGATGVAGLHVLLADSGGGPDSGVEASVAAGTGLGAGASTGEGAGSVISDGAEAENVGAGAGSAVEVGDIGSVGGTGGSMIGNASKDSSIAVGTRTPCRSMA